MQNVPGIDLRVRLPRCGWLVILAVVTLMSSPTTASHIDLTNGGNGYWRVFDMLRGSYSWDDSMLIFTSQTLNGSNYDLVGDFYWEGQDDGTVVAYGTEHFTGTFNHQELTIDLDGQNLIEPYLNLDLFHYDVTVNADGDLLSNGSWIPGRNASWSAELVNVPEPATLVLLGLGGLFLVRIPQRHR